MDKQRTIVKTKDSKGNDLELAILKPSNRALQEGQRHYNLKLADLVRRAGEGYESLISRHQLDEYLKKIGVWTAADQVTFQRMNLQVRECELKLKQGGIKLSEARQLALRMRDLRFSLVELYARRQMFDNTTMEQEAENHRFKFLMTQCVVYAETGEPFFRDVADYDEQDGEDHVADAARALAAEMYGYDPKAADETFENQWLRGHGFMNEDGVLVNQDGAMVDRTGRLINKHGQYVDDKGNPIDVEGNRVDDAGHVVVDDPQPYLDDETGEPIVGERQEAKGKRQEGDEGGKGARGHAQDSAPRTQNSSRQQGNEASRQQGDETTKTPTTSRRAKKRKG